MRTQIAFSAAMLASSAMALRISTQAEAEMESLGMGLQMAQQDTNASNSSNSSDDSGDYSPWCPFGTEAPDHDQVVNDNFDAWATAF